MAQTNLPIEAAFTNVIPVDLSKEFFPFGERPAFGETLYLAHHQAFSVAAESLTLHVNLINPASAQGELPMPHTNNAHNPALQWEFWDGAAWRPFPAPERDTTQAFTETGLVELKFPAQPQATEVNGVESFWLRVRLIGGHYGVEDRYEPDPENPRAGFQFIPGDLAPPSIRSITVDYRFQEAAPADSVHTCNDFIYHDHTSTAEKADGVSFAPFHTSSDIRTAADSRPCFYLGFTLPPGQSVFPRGPLSLFFRMATDRSAALSTPAAPRFVWGYWTGDAWATLTVRDHTEGFTRTGEVQFLSPPDMAAHEEFGIAGYWLRVCALSDAELDGFKLRRVLLNTTMAAQMMTIRDEILGTSSGRAGQTFRTIRAPVLTGQQLDVLEPHPATEEPLNRDAAEATPAVWVTWHEAPDLQASAPDDRHYVLDHLSGEVRFGDAQHGRIPPAGSTVRMTRYHIGGGVLGNRPAETIVELKTTLPYIDRATNLEAATGGTEQETPESLRTRAPRLLRHRNRAVTREDYEDLAMLASPDVARARCVPLWDLAAPDAPAALGTVSVIIVPKTADAQPAPSMELIRRVQDFLQAHSSPTVRIAVVGPWYRRIDVSAHLLFTSLQSASTMQQVVQHQLDRFLHPLTGGDEGQGWPFGRQPYTSDFFALIGALPGIDHVRTLTMTISPGDADHIHKRDYFLIAPGRHQLEFSVA